MKKKVEKNRKEEPVLAYEREARYIFKSTLKNSRKLKKREKASRGIREEMRERERERERERDLQESQNTQNVSKIAEKLPRRLPGGQKETQESPRRRKRASGRRKRASGGQKESQESPQRLQMAPKGAPKGPKSTQNGVQNGPQNPSGTLLAAILPFSPFFPPLLLRPGSKMRAKNDEKSEKNRVKMQTGAPRNAFLSICVANVFFLNFLVDCWSIFQGKSMKKQTCFFTTARVVFKLATPTKHCILRYESYFFVF